MSTKIFVLKLQSPQLDTPPNDYILLLNEHLTADEFVADLRELDPAIPTTNEKLRLVLEGSYRMTPRQFLRYMMTTVAYTPEVEGGVCVPKLLGRGNGIQVVSREGLEPTQQIQSRRSTVLSVPSSANMGKLAKEFGAIKISESPKPSSSREKVKRNTTQAESHPPFLGPTHENAKHELTIVLHQGSSILPAVDFPNITLENVPQLGGSQECLWLTSEILATLPEWLDRSAVKLRFFQSPFTRGGSSHVTWNKDSFRWSEGGKCWWLSIYAQISW